MQIKSYPEGYNESAYQHLFLECHLWAGYAVSCVL